MKPTNLIYGILASALIFSCSSQNKETSNESSTTELRDSDSSGDQEEIKEIEAVCIWDKVSVRKEPGSKAKWLTSISLGETLTFLGVQAVDSSDKNREYLKVRLADGKEGWSVSDFIVPDSQVGTFLGESFIYKRPDLLTKTDNAFSQMDIVAIKSSRDDWFEVVGKRSEGKWIESGWVKQDAISKRDIDIAAAKFGSQALKEGDDEKKINAIEEILNNKDLSGSAFISYLETELEELIAPEIKSPEDSITVTAAQTVSDTIM